MTANLACVLATQGEYWTPREGQKCNALLVWPFHYDTEAATEGSTDPPTGGLRRLQGAQEGSGSKVLVYACQDTQTGERFNLHRSSLNQMWQKAEAPGE